MLVAESRMVMGKAHVFHVGSLSYNPRQTADKGNVPCCKVPSVPAGFCLSSGVGFSSDREHSVRSSYINLHILTDVLVNAQLTCIIDKFVQITTLFVPHVIIEDFYGHVLSDAA